MRRLPALYAAFCLVVLIGFTYAKVEGLVPFGSSGAASSGHNGSSGGHGGGFLLGSHK